MIRNFLNEIRERWYFLVLRYFKYLDWNRISRSVERYGGERKYQAAVATIAGDHICADSGMCASKNWNDRAGKKPNPGAKFESTTRDRHDSVINMLLDLTGKPIPLSIDGVKPILDLSDTKPRSSNAEV